MTPHQLSHPARALVVSFSFLFLKIFLERGEGGRRKRRRKTCVWLPLEHPLLGTWSATQACAQTGNQTSDPLVCRPTLNTLNYTSQGGCSYFLTIMWLSTGLGSPWQGPGSGLLSLLLHPMNLVPSLKTCYFLMKPWMCAEN